MNTPTMTRALTFGAVLFAATPGVTADALVPHARMQRDVDVAITNVRGTVIEGVIRNNTGLRIEDPELSIHYAWLWSNALQPGEDDVGWVDTHTVDGELEPNAALPFTFDPGRAPPARDDGKLMPLVSVIGYTRFERN